MTKTLNQYNLTSFQLIEKAIENGEAHLSSTGALFTTTGKRSGRSPNDRFIVKEPSTSDSIEWGSVNRPIDATTFDTLWDRVFDYLANKERYVSHLHISQDDNHYIPVRVITETAWHGLYAKNMFVKKQTYNPLSKKPWTILHAANFVCVPKRDGTNSDGAVIIDFSQRKVLLAGMAYAGEMKKAMFSVLNYLLPKNDIMPMHCATQHLDILNLDIPLSVKGVDSKYLNPRKTWQNSDDYDLEAIKLAQLFVDNMAKFSPSEAILAAGPQPASEIVEEATVA